MSRQVRVSLLTEFVCQGCKARKVHRHLRVLRIAVQAVTGHLIEFVGDGGIRYCPRCDGQLARIACVNPAADAHTTGCEG